LPRYPDWKVIFAGAQRFEDAPPSAYEASIAEALNPIREQAEMTGFIPRPEIMDIQNRSAIILAPSEWQEPAGRVVIEALACGAALITSRRGGIPEYAEGRAIILDEGKPADLAEALERLITDENWRLSWQKKAWVDYPFDTAHMGAKLDKARYHALGITG
jgi:glycosyltransferase involved in cell wall biosynthesis